ncbi:hypothetical protein OY671_006274 [Metschnikowia pulcherrima]|nr:hypothetical protein OY671_006274 [Metschnikowia pulcherrima]
MPETEPLNLSRASSPLEWDDPRTSLMSASARSLSPFPSIPITSASAFSRRPTNISVEGILDNTQGEEIEEYPPNSRQTWFPKSHIIRVDLSEPRDVLQSERTFLGFIRFALSLYFTAIGLILGFRLKSDSDGDSGAKNTFSLFNKVVSFMLVFLAFSTLAMAAVNYFRTVRRYSQRKIRTHGTNNTVSVVCVTAVVVTLAGLNVSLIVERYLQES